MGDRWWEFESGECEDLHCPECGAVPRWQVDIVGDDCRALIYCPECHGMSTNATDRDKVDALTVARQTWIGRC